MPCVYGREGLDGERAFQAKGITMQKTPTQQPGRSEEEQEASVQWEWNELGRQQQERQVGTEEQQEGERQGGALLATVKTSDCEQGVWSLESCEPSTQEVLTSL